MDFIALLLSGKYSLTRRLDRLLAYLDTQFIGRKQGKLSSISVQFFYVVYQNFIGDV